MDYIFTDPPFGANIYCADCALLWESWLGEYTDPRDEILIHTKQRSHGEKRLSDYERLMSQAFVRMREVLKPGRMASVVFHSSHAAVWRAIQDAVRNAGRGYYVCEATRFGRAPAADSRRSLPTYRRRPM